MPYKDQKKQKQAQHNSYVRNKDKFRKRTKDLRDWFKEHTKNDICIACGEKEKCCIDYHHTDPTTKEDKINNIIRRFGTKDKILEELKKCVPLCSNCHRKVHAGVLDIGIRLDNSATSG